MLEKRLIATVGGTVACALGIGFFMQQGDAHMQQRDHLQSASLQQEDTGSTPLTDDAPLDLKDITLTSAATKSPVANFYATATHKMSQGTAVTPDGPSEPTASKLGCDVTAKATTSAHALVDLSVTAPCFANERVTIHHSGMMFSETVSPTGRLNVTIPALSKTAIFVVEFTNGQGAVATTKVSSLAEYDRVAVQWAGDSDFQVHAREFGAGYADVGHVWHGNGLGDQAVEQADSGFVVRLGDITTSIPKLVEIYTFPTGMAHKAGIVAVSVETEITLANCGRDISAQSLELRGGTSLRTRDLVLSMPDCSKVGDFLVLNNLVDDLKIAIR